MLQQSMNRNLSIYIYIDIYKYVNVKRDLRDGGFWCIVVGHFSRVNTYHVTRSRSFLWQFRANNRVICPLWRLFFHLKEPSAKKSRGRANERRLVHFNTCLCSVNVIMKINFLFDNEKICLYLLFLWKVLICNSEAVSPRLPWAKTINARFSAGGAPTVSPI